MKLKTIVFACIFASLLYGCMGTNHQYVNNDYNFSVVYPDDWKLAFQSKMEVGFTSTRQATLVPGCVIWSEELPPNWGAAEYVNNTESYYIKTLLPVANSHKNNVTINGMPAYEWNYTLTNVNGTILKFHNIVIAKNGIAYSIECSTTQDLYPEYEAQFNSIVTSFKITG